MQRKEDFCKVEAPGPDATFIALMNQPKSFLPQETWLQGLSLFRCQQLRMAFEVGEPHQNRQVEPISAPFKQRCCTLWMSHLKANESTYLKPSLSKPCLLCHSRRLWEYGPIRQDGDCHGATHALAWLDGTRWGFDLIVAVTILALGPPFFFLSSTEPCFRSACKEAVLFLLRERDIR